MFPLGESNYRLESCDMLIGAEWTKGDSFAAMLRIQTHVDESAEDFLSATVQQPVLGSFNIKWKR
jgi:hypothetical protein